MWHKVWDICFPPLCPGCGRESSSGSFCFQCSTSITSCSFFMGCLQVFAAGEYRAELKRAIRLYKLSGKRSYVNALADQMRGTLVAKAQPFLQRMPVIVPVPSSGSSRKMRGYCASGLLAEALSDKLDLKMMNWLKIHHGRQEQKGLSRVERLRSSDSKFYCSPISSRVDCILVDDVVATGSTLSECATILRQAGCGEIVAAVCAWVR